MAGRNRGEMPADLVRGARRFSQWRQTRERGTRIPDVLWDMAVELAGRYGLSRTSVALQLGYYELRKHVDHESRERQGSTPAPFVELPSLPWASGEGLLEFERPSGGKWRIQWKGGPPPDLVALARVFCETR